MLGIWRSSTLIRSNRRAMSVDTFSAQSLRRSVSRALIRARASRTRWRPAEPLLARASLCSSRRRLACSRAVRPGRCSSSPVDKAAETATPRSMPATRPLSGAGTGAGMAAKATCQRPARSLVTHRTSRPEVWRGTSGTGPNRPSGRGPRRHGGTGGARPIAVRAGPRSGIPRPGWPCARTAPGRVLRVEEPGHRLGEVPQRLLLHHLGADGQPRVFRPRLGELPTLRQVAWRALAAWMPVGVLLDSEVPHVPGVRAVTPQHVLLGGCGDQPVPRHTNTLANGTDISEEVKRRFLPDLKAAVSTPQI